jgi:hypothetical protein
MAIKPLTQKAMIVTLSISQWLARVKDRGITAKVAKDYAAKRSDVGTYTKRLIPLKGAMAKVNTVVSTIKSYHEISTLPWGRGERILMSSKWPEYSKKMRELTTEFDNAVTELNANFLDLKKDAEDLLGQMYKESDYPEHSTLKAKYDISVIPRPIPTEGDWRITLSDENLEELKKELREQETKKTENAMKEAWMKIYKPVKHMTEVLSKDKPKIFESLVTNVKTLVTILPDLNFTEDPELEKMRKEVEDKLCDITADQLRDSKYLRNLALEAAEGLRQKIKEKGEIEDEDILEMINGKDFEKVIGKYGKPVYEQEEMEKE